jgi:hypothetical protein
MRYTRKDIPALLAVLSAVSHRVHGATELSAIYETECVSDTAWNGPVDDCQSIINEIWSLKGQGGVGSSEGCVNLGTSTFCTLFVCDFNRPDTTVSYGAIATAAQIQHTICRNGPMTGGWTLVEGMQQPGEPHSSAKVSIHYSSDGISKRAMRFGDRSSEVAARSRESSLVARGDSQEVRLTPWRVDEEFSNNNALFEEGITSNGASKFPSHTIPENSTFCRVHARIHHPFDFYDR